MNILFCGGGTGGHLVIARSLASLAKERGHTVTFIGSQKGQDRTWFSDGKLFSDSYFLDTTGVVDKRGFGKIASLLKIIKAVFSSIKIMRDLKIDAVVSVGGFSAAPAAIAAILMRKKLYIHEQNAVVGKLNKLLRPFSYRFFSSYESFSSYPVDAKFFTNAKERESIETIIFLGGSQGAKYINNLALQIAPILTQKGIKIIHQCGVNDEERVRNEYKNLGIDAEIYGFYNDMPSLLKKADIAVSRSGASTLWELTASQIPTFFIPFAHAAADHQYHNARYIIEQNAGWCEREGDGVIDRLLEVLDSDISSASRELKNLIKPDGAMEIISTVESDFIK